jgi:asparagine synthase (glutamine-hydrolysing)
MCGIAGIHYADAGQNPSISLIKSMTDAIAHRGPDGEGFHAEHGIVLGHRRLAVIDPAGGEQPMFNEDHSVAIVFNGEIYNFETLRTELTAAGHVFRNRCDTEAIVHAWEQWGPGCVTRLSGMFAFAIWDRNRQQLFLARDRLGKKPLYYAWAGKDLVFGSELAALRPVPNLPRVIRPQAVEDFFAFGYVPEPQTIFAGILKLPAAHTLLIEKGGRAEPRPYWAPPTHIQAISEADALPLLRAKLTEAVQKRLVSDVPLGAFLSGGVDSSAVVACAAGPRGGQLDTFTIGFDGAEDETPYARLVAQRYGTRQHEERAGTLDMIAGARIQAAVFGEPFGDSSSVPTLAVCRLARRHATVAVSGDGGDEVFAGYRRTRWHMMVSAARRYMPGPVRRQFIGRLAALYPKLDRAPRFLRAKHTLTELSLDDVAGFARISTKVHAERRRALFSPSLRAALAGHDPFAPLAAQMHANEDCDPLLQAQLADLATWLPGDILTKADRASMAASLDMRAPFLDHELVEWGLALPASLKIRGGQGKYVLKKALEPLLPHDLLYRPKQGFTSDLAPLFRAQSARLRTILLGPHMMSHGLFDAGEIARVIDEHEAGGTDHAAILWPLLAFEGFLATMDQSAVSGPKPPGTTPLGATTPA